MSGSGWDLHHRNADGSIATEMLGCLPPPVDVTGATWSLVRRFRIETALTPAHVCMTRAAYLQFCCEASERSGGGSLLRPTTAWGIPVVVVPGEGMVVSLGLSVDDALRVPPSMWSSSVMVVSADVEEEGK